MWEGTCYYGKDGTPVRGKNIFNAGWVRNAGCQQTSLGKEPSGSSGGLCGCSEFWVLGKATSLSQLPRML